MNVSIRSFIVLLCLSVLIGCSKKADPTGNHAGTLKVMYSDRHAFNNEYGLLFMSKFPNTDFEVVSTGSMSRFLADHSFDSAKAAKAFIDAYKPDIILTDIGVYAELAESGYLAELDSFINSDAYSLDSLNPNVMDLLRHRADGRLYGLAPAFASTALYYNIDLFHEHGIDPPGDGMHWGEVLQLAARFPARDSPEEGVAGFSGRAPLWSLVSEMASAEGLNLYDSLSNEPTIHSDKWRAIFETVVEAEKSGALSFPDRSDQRNRFVEGRSAMTVDRIHLIEAIRSREIATGSKLNFGVVAAPVGLKTGTTGDFQMIDLFGIYSGSKQQALAWEFIKYVAGEDYAKMKSKSSPHLLARSSFLTEKDGIGLEPFHKAKANPDAKPNLGARPEIYSAFISALSEELPKAALGEQTLDETIDSLWSTLQEVIIKIQRD